MGQRDGARYPCGLLPGRRRPRIGMVLEGTLGHVTHDKNLRAALTGSPNADLAWETLSFEPQPSRLRPTANWTIRSGLAARRAIAGFESNRSLDALFVHSQVPAMALQREMRAIPTVVSLDATPCQLDDFASSYGHGVHPAPVEAMKLRLHRACFNRAASIVTWSNWTAASLVADYGIEREKIDVIPPGVTPSHWRRPEHRDRQNTSVKMLFVGGDFDRKGGPELLEAFARLRVDPEIVARGTQLELHLVTDTELEPAPGVHHHQGLRPNCAELVELFHQADVFVLPSKADCLAMVMSEAACAGLPLVGTTVGAMGEILIDGTTGLVVDGTPGSIAASLRRLILNVDLRLSLGDGAAKHAATFYDAEANAARLLERLVRHARPAPAAGRAVLTVSGDLDKDRFDQVTAGERPLADYDAIAQATGAELLDYSSTRSTASVVERSVATLLRPDAAMALALFRKRADYDVIVTDSELVGLILALLLRVGGRRGVRHVMIAHCLTPLKKRLPIKALGLSRGVDEVLTYATSQRLAAEDLFRRPGQQVQRIDFMVDTSFFDATTTAPRSAERTKLIVSAGREFRDYPALIAAVADIDAHVVIASDSPWSRREDNAHDVELPSNVSVTRLSQRRLRDVMDAADLVVVPLQPTDFQAGITTILEAMSMSCPVVTTATTGQNDVIDDGVTGRYVPVGDVKALNETMTELLMSPTTAREMGRAGRQVVVERADVRFYAATFADVVDRHSAIARRSRHAS